MAHPNRPDHGPASKAKNTPQDDEDIAEDQGDQAPPKTFSIVLLAAGSSSRMGHSKQLLQIDGEPLLLRSAKAALASGANHVVVILGANEQAHREVIRKLPVTIILNHYWKSGMGSSIKTGMNNLLRAFPETTAVIIMVCDQPEVNEHHLHTLIETYEQTNSPIIASSYADTVGVPALFARPFFSNILMLSDEQGAKKILQQFSTQITKVNFPAGSYDLDTDDDYQNFINSKK